MTNRMEMLIDKAKEHQLDGFFVTSKANVYYLSNYYTEPHERLVAVYISASQDPLLIVPEMEKADAKNAGWKFTTIGYQDHEDPWEMFLNFLKKGPKLPETIGVEHNHFTLERAAHFKKILPNAACKDAQNLLASLRVIKNKKEYTLLKQAAALADHAIETGIKALHEGVSELDVIAEIEYEMKKQGVQEMSFPTTVLFGAKTASPHGTPGLAKLKKGDFVLFDLGVIFEGYCSDMTRTVAYHSISEEQKKIYETVLNAEQKAIAASQLGTAVGKVDLAARKVIDDAGYGPYFTHRIGHGLGIETHEYPSMHSNNELPLEEGMCFTTEPGIYISEIGGVRIEDMIFMTEKGPEQLTQYPKELQIID